MHLIERISSKTSSVDENLSFNDVLFQMCRAYELSMRATKEMKRLIAAESMYHLYQFEMYHS